MYAAAAGHSTLGIPAKVGQEFVRATPKAQRKALSSHQAAAKGFRQRTKDGYA